MRLPFRSLKNELLLICPDRSGGGGYALAPPRPKQHRVMAEGPAAPKHAQGSTEIGCAADRDGRHAAGCTDHINGGDTGSDSGRLRGWQHRGSRRTGTPLRHSGRVVIVSAVVVCWTRSTRGAAPSSMARLFCCVPAGMPTPVKWAAFRRFLPFAPGINAIVRCRSA